MKVQFNSAYPTPDNPLLLNRLKLGDELVVRVSKRVAPFRYIVNFRGQSLAVNSTVYLQPDDRILIQLIKVHPRLQFKFIAHLKNQSLVNSSFQFTALFGYENHPLSQLYLTWAVRLNFPVRRSEYKKLKALYFSGKKGVHSAERLVIPFFWFKESLEGLPFYDPYFLLHWLTSENSLNSDRHQLNDQLSGEEKGTQLRNLIRHHRLLKNLSDILTLGNLLRGLNTNGFHENNLFSQLKSQLRLDNQDLGRGNGELSEHFGTEFRKISDLILYLKMQFYFYDNGHWACFPFYDAQAGQHYLTFWRKQEIKQDNQYEFMFEWNSNFFGIVGVKGKIGENKLNLQIFNSHQGLLNLVDKYKSQLIDKIKNRGLRLVGFELKPGRDFYLTIGKMLLSDQDNQIEVFI